MNLPADDFILLSVVNTKLRDNFSSLEDLCYNEGVSVEELDSRLAQIGYVYDGEENAFRRA